MIATCGVLPCDKLKLKSIHIVEACGLNECELVYIGFPLVYKMSRVQNQPSIYSCHCYTIRKEKFQFLVPVHTHINPIVCIILMLTYG